MDKRADSLNHNRTDFQVFLINRIKGHEDDQAAFTRGERCTRSPSASTLSLKLHADRRLPWLQANADFSVLTEQSRHVIASVNFTLHLTLCNVMGSHIGGVLHSQPNHIRCVCKGVAGITEALQDSIVLQFWTVAGRGEGRYRRGTASILEDSEWDELLQRKGPFLVTQSRDFHD